MQIEDDELSLRLLRKFQILTEMRVSSEYQMDGTNDRMISSSRRCATIEADVIRYSWYIVGCFMRPSLGIH